MNICKWSSNLGFRIWIARHSIFVGTANPSYATKNKNASFVVVYALSTKINNYVIFARIPCLYNASMLVAAFFSLLFCYFKLKFRKEPLGRHTRRRLFLRVLKMPISFIYSQINEEPIQNKHLHKNLMYIAEYVGYGLNLITWWVGVGLNGEGYVKG